MLKDLVLKNRSFRGFDRSYRFTREELEDLVDCARLCPSSINRQPLKYYIAWEEETVSRIQAQTKWGYALRPAVTLPRPGKEPSAFIVICQDENVDPHLNLYMRDVGIAAQTILLAAVERELGGCMIGSFGAGSVKEALGLPATLHPQLIVALGKPDEEIVIEDVKDGETAYYRDENDVHHVPKRALKDIIIN